MDHTKSKANPSDDNTKPFGLANVIVKPATNELIINKKTIQVEDKVMKVLVYLVSSRERIVSREELFQHLWPNVYVSQGSLTRCISILRNLLSDKGDSPQVILTIRNRGYRIVCPIKRIKNNSTLHLKKTTFFHNSFGKLAYVASGIMMTLATAFFIIIFNCYL